VFESIKHIPVEELHPDDMVKEVLSNALDSAKRQLLHQVEGNSLGENRYV